MHDISEWSITRHALRRAVEMALDPDEIREALIHPTRPLPAPGDDGSHRIHTERIYLVVDLARRRVITIGWNSFDGKRIQRYDRDDISLCRDPQDI